MNQREQPASAFGTLTVSHKLFVGLSVVFVSCLLLGDIIGGKTLSTPLGPISVGMLPFPVTFLLTDIVNDFYGSKGAHFLTAVGFWMALFAWVILQASTALPIDGSTYITQPEFSKIFGGSSQLFVASMAAYLLGQLIDVHVFQFWKGLTASRHLWLRATGSTILSQAIDTTTVNAVFWKWTAGREWGWIFAKIGREYSIKLVIAVALTPVVYALHTAMVRGFGLEPEKHVSR